MSSPAQWMRADLAATQDEFESIRTWVYETCGIALGDDKRAMVDSRLRPIVARYECRSFEEYFERARSDPSGKMRSELINRLSTNHTFFNRESSHFTLFRDRVLPEAIARNRARRELRVWCAASSTGEEAYTLAAIIMDVLGVSYSSWKAGLLATDINDEVLATARAGEYPEDEVAKLPFGLAKRYFKPKGDGNVVAVAELRREILFRRLNLNRPSFPFRAPFDAIFCRNVMIYFDPRTKRELVARLAKFLAPGGYLFIGSAESIAVDHVPLTVVGPSVFRRG